MAFDIFDNKALLEGLTSQTTKDPLEGLTSQTRDPTATDLCVWNLVSRNQIKVLTRIDGNRDELLAQFKTIALDLEDKSDHSGQRGVSKDSKNRAVDSGHDGQRDISKDSTKPAVEGDHKDDLEIHPNKVKKHNRYPTDFVAVHLLDWYQYAISRSFNAPQTSAILGIAYKSHAHFLESQLATPLRARDTVEFFKWLMILHSVADLPQSIRVFSPTQCCDAVEYFVRSYVKMMPLVRFLHFPRGAVVDCGGRTVDANM